MSVLFNIRTKIELNIISVRRLKLRVENTIRWRYGYDKESNVIKESNARFVRWSDGSMTLHVGSEIFDVYKQPFVVSAVFTVTFEVLVRVSI